MIMDRLSQTHIYIWMDYMLFIIPHYIPIRTGLIFVG
jgi:hypothetical protein